MQLEERERERERGSDSGSGSVCVSVENSSFSCKKPEEKGKISRMQDSHTFLQKGLVSQKGSGFLPRLSIARGN